MTRRFLLVCLALNLVAPSTLAVDLIPGSSIDRAAAPQTEAQMLAVLRSDAPGSEKAAACKLLAIHGSSKAAPELAKLLPDKQLASWARIALEAIPDAACDQALRDATASLNGDLLVGVINSIGVRRDTQAIKLLSGLLKDQDANVAAAAAVALGRIGGPEAAEHLRQSLAIANDQVRSAVAEGCILTAERFLADGDATGATRLFDQVRAASLPQQRIIEATRGAILARGQAGIELLVDQLRSTDEKMFQLALGTFREFPAEGAPGSVDRVVAQELAAAPPTRAALIVQAMADRPESVLLSAVVQSAQQGPPEVRAAAVRALGRVGDVSCVECLLEIALDGDSQLRADARQTLADLPGENVDARLVQLLSESRGARYPVLLEVVGLRRIAATPQLLQGLEHADASVREAALTALGETIALDQLPVLIEQVVRPRRIEDEAIAQQALRSACIRMPDREACAARLADAIENSSSVSTKIVLLKILGEMGGPQALAAIAASARSDNTDLQDIGSQLLGSWMTADAAPVLLDLAKTLSPGKYQVRALRGYIRIARQFELPPGKRTEMCRQALAVCERASEQKLVLEVLARYPNADNLKLATQAMEIPAIRTEATAVSKAIADQLAKRGS
jgi:HEAT repeat protein